MIEGAAYTLSVSPDPKLDAYVDGLIAKIAAAQEPDGYSTRRGRSTRSRRIAGRAPSGGSSNATTATSCTTLGHLIEAAVAHKLATGKDNLLNVAVKAADLLVQTFGPGKRSTWPGHQITEMALVRLYRRDQQQEYLDLAKFLIDERGPGPDPKTPIQFPNGERANPRGLEYNQAQQEGRRSGRTGRPRRARDVHVCRHGRHRRADERRSIRTASLRHLGQPADKQAVSHRRHRRGRRRTKGSARPTSCRTATAYNETCASVGMDYWNHRLFLLEGDAKYIDVMERTLYNGLISGVSLDGKTFFYPNVLESNGRTRAARGSASPAARGTSPGSWLRCRATSTRREATPST